MTWPPLKFDPSRDPARDLDRAAGDATRAGKRIILDVGGEWCSWCHILDAFIAEHAELKAAIARDYVWLKINMSPENENKVFLSEYPKIPGYPHLFVLEQDGTLLHSQGTAELEEGKSYHLGRVRDFLERWRRPV
jgi:thiol:disulfide interchange protein